MFETVKLMKRIQPESYDIAIVAPYMGTPIHTLAHSRGLIDADTEPGFVNMDKNIGYRRGSVIKNPYVSEKEIKDIVDKFFDYVSGKLPIPEEFMDEAPGTSPTAPERTGSFEEAKIIDVVFQNAEKEKERLRNIRNNKI